MLSPWGTWHRVFFRPPDGLALPPLSDCQTTRSSLTLTDHKYLASNLNIFTRKPKCSMVIQRMQILGPHTPAESIHRTLALQQDKSSRSGFFDTAGDDERSGDILMAWHLQIHLSHVNCNLILNLEYWKNVSRSSLWDVFNVQRWAALHDLAPGLVEILRILDILGPWSQGWGPGVSTTNTTS